MSKQISVYIADDHKIVIEGIIAVIETDPELAVIGYSHTGKDVIHWLNENIEKADVVVLDITMPEADGFEVLKFLTSKRSKQKVIVLSSYNDVKIVEEVLRFGAMGYITKTNAGEHITEAIKVVNSGNKYFSDDIQKLLLKSISGAPVEGGEMPDQFLLKSLTDREKDVLRLVAKEYNTTEIADELCLGISTVETHRKKLLKKLNVKNSVGLAMYAVKNKLV